MLWSPTRFDVDQSGGYSLEEWWEKDWQGQLLYDADRNGLVTRSEYMVEYNNTGRTQDEGMRYFLTEMRRNREGHFRRYSRGRDHLQRSGLERDVRLTFRAHDIDGDGEVTPADMRRVSQGELRLD
jgi:Ca2+-binding EF-hand superfamily protein